MRPVGLRRLRQVDGEEVGLGDDLVERQQLDAELAGPVGGDERVVGDEAHAEATGPVGDELADAAEADDAERLVGQLDALPPAALPAPGDEGRVGLGHVAGLGQQQRHRVLGGRHDVALRRVDDHHAAAGGRVDVDVVEADAGPADDEQVGAGGEHLGGDRGGGADDQGVGADDGVEQLVGRQAGPHVDLVAGRPQAVEPAVGDLFGDEDAGHGRHAYRRRSVDTNGLNRATPGHVRRRTSHSDAATLGWGERYGPRSWWRTMRSRIERWFVERGLPHFVERHDTASEIWGRALPLLVAAYLLLGLNALDLRDWSAGREHRRRRLRRRSARSSPGSSPTGCAAGGWFERPGASAPPSWPCSSIVPGRALDRRRAVGRRRCRPSSRRSPCSPLLWAITSYGVPRCCAGRGSAPWPSCRCCSTSSSGPCRCCCCSRRSCSSTPRCGRWPAR